MKTSLKLALFVAMATIFSFASAITPSNIVDSLSPYDITSAWDLQLTQSFRVTALDYYDSGAVGGLLTSHQVGLWTNNGTLLAVVTIPSGTSATLIGSYRSMPIAPIILAPGFYEVGGFVPSYTDPYIYNATGTTLPGILYYESHVRVGPFGFAGSANLVSTEELTANFEATPVGSTPEPATLGLLSAGLSAVGLLRRRRG